MEFRFLNIPVRIHPTFWIFLLFFTNFYQDPSFNSIVIGMIMIFSLLVHEYGHALTAMYFGARPTVNLEGFGGNAQYNGRGISPKQEFLITLNGPLLQSLLIVLPYMLLKLGTFQHMGYVSYLLYVTMRINILWLLLNLIPIAPLDGGHLARYVLERKFGERGYRFSIVFGLVCVGVVAPYLLFKGYFFFGALIAIYGIQNYLALQKMKGSSGGYNPFKSYLQGVEAIRNNDLEKAKAILNKLRKSKDPKIKHSALESLAKVYVQEEEGQKAYDLLLGADHALLKEGKCLLCKLAFEKKNYGLVGKYSWDIYNIEPSQEIALMNSQAFAHLNEPALSGAWKETASQFERGG